jgi:DNA-binding MarR family transcriptional regulator
VPLGQGCWAVPDVPAASDRIARATELAGRGDGEVLVLQAAGRGQADAARLEQLFTEARQDEWAEFLAGCGKFTLAELEEEEQSLDRLRCSSVLAMLSEAPHRTLRMTALAVQTSATLPRLSHVVQRLETRGLVERFPCPQDGRATNARLTATGWRKLRDAAPGHAANVRRHVIDALTPGQVTQLTAITEAILQRLDPDAVTTATFRRRDQAPDDGLTRQR